MFSGSIYCCIGSSCARASGGRGTAGGWRHSALVALVGRWNVHARRRPLRGDGASEAFLHHRAYCSAGGARGASSEPFLLVHGAGG